MNEEDIRKLGGELADTIRPLALSDIHSAYLPMAERIFDTTATLLVQVLVDINRIATAVEQLGPAKGRAACEKYAGPSIYEDENFKPVDMVLD